jgi:hypothetical protein
MGVISHQPLKKNGENAMVNTHHEILNDTVGNMKQLDDQNKQKKQKTNINTF